MITSLAAVITGYDPTRDLIIVKAHVQGEAAALDVHLVLDTGCAQCTLRPAVANALGYGVERQIRSTAVRTALGVEHGYMINLAAFDALGHGFREFPVNVFALAGGDDIDGLLGLRFLNELNYEIRAREGIIIAEKAA